MGTGKHIRRLRELYDKLFIDQSLSIATSSYIDRARFNGDMYLIGGPDADVSEDQNREFIVRNPPDSGIKVEIVTIAPSVTTNMTLSMRAIRDFDWPSGGTEVDPMNLNTDADPFDATFESKRGQAITSGAIQSDAKLHSGVGGSGGSTTNAHPAALGSVPTETTISPGDVAGWRTVPSSSGELSWWGYAVEIPEVNDE